MFRWSILPLLAALAACASGPDPRPTVAAVASAHPLATDAALRTLQRGGNAFDAAVTAAAVLAVVEPFGSGLGGGGFFLLHRAADRRDVVVDARETAPLGIRAETYLDAKGNPVPRATLDGPLAAGIPGTPAGLAHIAQRYGRWPLRQSLEPAVHVARQGFEVTGHYARMARLRHGALLASADSSYLFLDGGQIPRAGYVVRQPELAHTLERLSRDGRNGFYAGEVARRMVEGVRAGGGIWSMRDLAAYRVVERDPVRFHHRGMTITAVPLPSSGGLLLAKMLRQLESSPNPLSTLEGQRTVIDAMRGAFRERVRLGDSDFATIDTSVFFSPGRAELRAENNEPPRGANTTHFSIIDAEGNRVAATLSLNLPFGSGFTAPGTGVLLNNQMDDFAIKPGTANVYGLAAGAANAVEPGKRPLSSMSPTFLETGDAVAVLGTPGGSRIPSMMLLAALDFEQGVRDPAHLVSRARFHHQDTPDRIDYEAGAFTEAERFRLDQWGYALETRPDGYGNMQAVVWNRRTGEVVAASDPRGEGTAATARVATPRAPISIGY